MFEVIFNFYHWIWSMWEWRNWTSGVTVLHLKGDAKFCTERQTDVTVSRKVFRQTHNKVTLIVLWPHSPMHSLSLSLSHFSVERQSELKQPPDWWRSTVCSQFDCVWGVAHSVSSRMDIKRWVQLPYIHKHEQRHTCGTWGQEHHCSVPKRSRSCALQQWSLSGSTPNTKAILTQLVYLCVRVTHNALHFSV